LEIPYCYANQAARTRNQQSIDVAVEAWISALGGPASAATGHTLSIAEVLNVNGPMLCYGDDYQDFEHPGTWNPGLDHHTLAIHAVSGEVSTSTVGYDTRTYVPPGRHVMKLHTARDPDVQILIHEVIKLLIIITLNFAYQAQTDYAP
jgi:hypothetical protein